MISITCPICSGPLELHAAPGVDAETTDPVGESADADAQADVTRALHAAVRALEDQAAGARWRLTQPNPPPALGHQLQQSRQHIELLHSLIRR